jgi:drug/metabolite transporter (DMT)-like permease
MTSRSHAEGILLLCTLIWGGTFIVTKGGLSDISPMLLVAIRYGFAALLFVPLVIKSLRGMNASTMRYGTVLGILMFGGIIAQTIGLQYTTASKSSFITAMSVVLTPLCQIMIERRMPKAGNWLGIALVTFGLYWLTSPGGGSFNRGDAWTLFCAVLFALYIVFLDIFSKKSPPVQLAAIQMIAAAALAGFGALYNKTYWRPTLPLAGTIAYLALPATLFTLWAHTHYQRYSTPTRAAVIFTLEPLIASLIAYGVAGEQLHLMGWIGAALILAGLLTSELSEQIRPGQEIRNNTL